MPPALAQGIDALVTLTEPVQTMGKNPLERGDMEGKPRDTTVMRRLPMQASRLNCNYSVAVISVYRWGRLANKLVA
ncbi:hypothetical protein [Undibacterium sp. Ji42W]|uniref:hypothetical protein n=1 Tax=Undibacterium sp. Ji42W TaxID=3413039 RepID=UPI003BF5CDB4